MGFFNALKRLLPHASHARASEESRQRIRAAWGLDDDESDTAGKGEDHGLPSPPTGSNASVFDHARWQKRLRRVLDGLPGSQPQWHDLMTEAHALQLEPDWIAGRQREEFAFIIRRAVADKVISEEDHHKLDLARKLIGLSEAEAEAALHAVLAEAEAFFGAPVKRDM
ncbi:MAG: hypothetical protein ACLQU5_16295 [Isosphaeraceae bacterium]